jgi:hypothetical protein
MSVTLSPGHVHGWAGWWIRRPPLELGLVPSVGGRLMSMRWRGQELSFVHPDHAGRQVALEAADPRARKRALGFVHWGGDKTWLAPQEAWTDAIPFLDLDAGTYDLAVERERPDEVRVTMRSPVCRELGVRIVRTVTVAGGTDEIEVLHALENPSESPVTRGVWDVHQVCAPGVAYVPRRRSGSAFPDGVRAFPLEGDSEAARPDVVRLLDAVAAIDCLRPRWFKFGVDADEGWALGIMATPQGLVGYRKEVPVAPDATYGHGCVVEVYNCPEHPYFELEAHGPVVTLAPGERTTLVERRRVFDVAAWPATADEIRTLGCKGRGGTRMHRPAPEHEGNREVRASGDGGCEAHPAGARARTTSN